jgi:DNA-binding CsgD family transcriptional regulator
MTVDVEPERLSDVIGKIYDSAVDPVRWPAALEAACRLIGATLGFIGTFDAREKTVRWTPHWGGDPFWLQLLYEKYAAVMPFWRIMPQFEIGEVANTRVMVERMDADEDEVRSLPFFREWAEPAGYRDVAAAIIMRSDSRVASFSLLTPPTRDLIGPDDLAVVSLLMPHVRRAVAIGDLLDMRSLATAALEATLDALAAAIVLVDAEARVVHANTAAQRMFAAAGPVLSVRGELNTNPPDAATALKDAIARAAIDESTLGYGGIGVPIRARAGQVDTAHVIAHVLPLRSGALRPALSLGATAAVFISPELERPQPPFEALAALYDLTPMEARVMLEIAAGKNRAGAAETLGIADSTVKTHLTRVFAKTRTSEQAELARLVANLTPPLLASG